MTTVHATTAGNNRGGLQVIVCVAPGPMGGHAVLRSLRDREILVSCFRWYRSPGSLNTPANGCDPFGIGVVGSTCDPFGIGVVGSVCDPFGIGVVGSTCDPFGIGVVGSMCDPFGIGVVG